MRYILLALAVAQLVCGQALLDPITANTLKGHVSFLASDALEGRDTPSRGLTVAAEYIASQFRRFGLEPAGGDGYFQNAPYVTVRQPMDTFELTIESGGKTLRAARDGSTVTAFQGAALKDLKVVKVSIPDENAVLPARAAVEGNAVLLVSGPVRSLAMARKRQALFALNPALVLIAGPAGFQQPRLREVGADVEKRVPTVTVSDAELSKIAQDLPEGATDARLSARIPAPVEEPAGVKNVIGVLRGSDPALKETYILLTAHYDHTGMRTSGEGDRIYNGANDDASGVATVLSLAEAFARAPQRPRRTLVFMTYFGEETGLVGSRYYARSPVFPLAATVANLNFEHMGRTDDNEGPRAGKLTATGYDYTTLTEAFIEAGKTTGIEVWKHERNSDGFFGASDNQALADAGIPAITLCVVWIFPDYHRPGDHWDKLDYANMEREVRTAALAVQRVADNSEAPKWIESNPKVARYLKAWQQLHATH